VEVVRWSVGYSGLFEPLYDVDCRCHCVAVFRLRQESKELVSEERVDGEKAFL